MSTTADEFFEVVASFWGRKFPDMEESAQWEVRVSVSVFMQHHALIFKSKATNHCFKVELVIKNGHVYLNTCYLILARLKISNTGEKAFSSHQQSNCFYIALKSLSHLKIITGHGVTARTIAM